MISFFKNNKGDTAKKVPIWILLVGGLIGVALILFGAQEPENTQTAEESPSAQELDTISYQEYLETRIEALCASMGLGDTEAIVTAKGSYEWIYATEQTEDTEEYVIVGSGSSAQPLLLAKQAPEILGIGVVVRGSLSPTQHDELLSLLSATFHTSSNRIYVTSGS